MSDFIERDAAMNVEFRVTFPESTPSERRVALALEEYSRQIEALPSADVRPVVRGEWTGETVWTNEEHAMQECKRCHKVRIVDNFCSNCGADMRGGDTL